MRQVLYAACLLSQGCIVHHAVDPQPVSSAPPPLDVALVYNTVSPEAADLTAGIEEAMEAAGAIAATRPQPHAGMGVQIRIKPRGWLKAERVWYWAAAFSLFLLPAYENDFGWDVELTVYANGHKRRVYTYEVLRQRFTWLPLSLVAWVNVWTQGDREAGRQLVQDFLHQAHHDGVLRRSTLAMAPPVPEAASSPIRLVPSASGGVRLEPEGRLLSAPDFYTLAGRADLAWEYRSSKERNQNLMLGGGLAAVGGYGALVNFAYQLAIFWAAREIANRPLPGDCRVGRLLCEEVGLLTGAVVSGLVGLVGSVLLGIGIFDNLDPLDDAERQTLMEDYNRRVAMAPKPAVLPEPEPEPEPEPTEADPRWVPQPQQLPQAPEAPGPDSAPEPGSTPAPDSIPEADSIPAPDSIPEADSIPEPDLIPEPDSIPAPEG